jgi:cytochrome bd-type quinol oxidase subunit 1
MDLKWLLKIELYVAWFKVLVGRYSWIVDDPRMVEVNSVMRKMILWLIIFIIFFRVKGLSTGMRSTFLRAGFYDD